MFALAIWDAREQRLLLARDRMGQKPLYYSTEEPSLRIMFASELRAFAAASDRSYPIDPKGVASYLAFGATGNRRLT